MSYVAIGTRGAVAIHRGFSCTPDERTRELQAEADAIRRDAGLPGIGPILQIELYGSRNAADMIAGMYDRGEMKPSQKQHGDPFAGLLDD